MGIIRQIFDRKGFPLLASMFLLLFIAETKRELRRRKGEKLKRIITNTLVSLPAFSLLRFLFLPLVIRLAGKNTHWKIGISYLYPFPGFIRNIIVFLLLDYSNYLWHRLNHKSKFLWRFHLVHHTDVDLDLSTAIRFHFGEMIGSLFYRGAAVLFIGASPALVLYYEIVFEAATQFHHSNWKLPLNLERKLHNLIVTPRMHGIHHSNIREETDSNYSVIFSGWDKLHQTLKLNKAQSSIIIGVPSYSDAKEQTASFLLKLPFVKIRDWEM